MITFACIYAIFGTATACMSLQIFIHEDCPRYPVGRVLGALLCFFIWPVSLGIALGNIHNRLSGR